MTTPSNHYDVIVLGTQPGPMLAGALLAKRGFRVLLLGQDDVGPVYTAADRVLPRAPYTFLGVHSPVARRIFQELALHQLFRRRAASMDPAFQVALPRHRLDLPLDDVDLEREIEREFPEVKRPIDDFHKSILRTAGELDRILDRDLVWPPESFLERRELARASSQLPFGKDGDGPDPLAELPDEHPFRQVVQAPVRFAEGADPDHPTALRVSRHFASWLRGAATVEGGWDWIRKMLIDRVRAHSGEIRERERADQILLKRNVAVGVRVAGSGELIGSTFVVYGGDVASLLRVLPDRHPFEELFEKIGEPQARWYRYTLNVLVPAEAVPVGMARDVFFVRDARRPLASENLLRVEVGATDPEGNRLLCTEALLPRRAIEDAAGFVESVRERVLGSLGELVPFLGRHVILVDSPHDGRDLQDHANKTTIPPAEPWTRGPQTMQAVHGYPVTTAFGLCAMPVRTPIKKLLLGNRQVCPGLGDEGAFVTAWSVARIVTKSDRRKEQLRRSLWTKVEI
jgi:hypothetical protein